MTTRRVIFPDPDIWGRSTTKENPVNIPRDVVAPTPPTREQILRWNAAPGMELSVSVPGEINDEGVGPTTRYHDTVAPLPVYRDQLDAVGLTERDVPNLTVYDRKETR